MSMTKNFYHEEICAASNPHFGELQDAPQLTDEELSAAASELFSDRKISHDGYEEFVCDLCGEGCDNDFGHKECCDAENLWSDMQD